MEYVNPNVYLEVWGNHAIFTRPEFKVERYSYDILTPSAARNILQQVYWHPQFQYEINKIHVFNEIRRVSITRNELAKGKVNTNLAKRAIKNTWKGEDNPSLSIPASMPRQQRASVFLADVHYGIEATIKQAKGTAFEDFRPIKFAEIFKRRVEHGQCHSQPYLGAKECLAHFGAQRYDTPSKSFYDGSTLDLGVMLYDLDYRPGKDEDPVFFHPVMINGTVKLKTQQEVMGDAAYCVD